MRRPLLALLAALLGVVSLAAPAGAGERTDIVIGRTDGSFVVESVPSATVGSALARAERDPDVAWAEVDATFSATAAVTPDDELFPEQWGPTRVRAPEAWGRSTGASSVVVAVVDSGVDATHPDLAGNVLPGADFVNDGRSGDPAGHGTGVAGVVAGRGNNGTGIAGYCWSCKILPVRALDADGNGTSSTIANGINWAATHGADIINLSLAGVRSSTTLDTAIAAARARGIIVVAAAGNRTSAGQNLTLPQYPAASEGVIGVVATNRSDQPEPWTFRGTWADVTAPSCALTTTPGGGYEEQCGTSFAAPAVAGILGLALGGFTKAPLPTVEAELLATSVPVGAIAAHGRVDAAALLDRLAAAFPNAIVPERVAGANRVATAVALSKRAFAAADTVVLARSDSYADALAAAPLAGRFHAPVLLTGSTTLDPSVAAEIRRLGATTAWLIGGEGALSPTVAAALPGLGVARVPRLAGSSRYDTARLIAEELGQSSVFVTQAGGWPDAVAVSGLAALTATPILLVDQGSVPAATLQGLTTLSVTNVTVFGGPSVVSDAVLAALRAGGRTVTRVSGASRYETSKAIATLASGSGGDATRTWLATGVDWPDALAAGPAAAAQGAVLLLVNGRDATGTPSVTSWLQGVTGGVKELVIVGGEASVTSPTFARLASVVAG